MKQTFIKLAIIVTSLIGLIDSSYITVEKLSGAVVKCGTSFDCGTVLNSSYAHLGPIPISVFGMIYYLTILILSSVWFLELPIAQKKKTNLLRRLSIPESLTGLTLFGFGFSLYLVYLMKFVINAWCFFCLISATTSTILFLIMLFYNLVEDKPSYYYLKGWWLELVHWLYKLIVKPICFLLDAEFVHDMVTSIGETLGQSVIGKKVVAQMLKFSRPDSAKQLMGIKFPALIGLAAGFDYNGRLSGILSSVGFGWQTIGTVTFDPYQGNKKPRLGRFPKSKALLINKGLKSWGAKKIIRYLKAKKRFEIPTAISIASTNKLFKNDTEQIKDILKTFWLFEKSGLNHSLYELNISCPNTFGGEPFTTPKRLAMLLSAIDQLNLSRPVFIKMPIDQSEKETLSLLKVADKHQIKGVIFGNLTKDHSNPKVDPEDRKSWANKKGNLSGKPTFERSNKLIALTKKYYKDRFVIVGTGGIFSAKDAQEKIKAGADLLQLITGMIFEGPQLISQINRELMTE